MACRVRGISSSYRRSGSSPACRRFTSVAKRDERGRTLEDRAAEDVGGKALPSVLLGFDLAEIVVADEGLRTNADDRLPRASLGRVQGGDGIVEGSHVADVCPQSSVPHPLD